MRVSNRQLAVAVPLLMLFLLQVPVARAGNMSFIKDAPMGKFTDEDMKLMNANLDTTWAKAKVQTGHSWSNPKTNHSGTAEALQAFEGPNGIPCKRVRISNRAGNLTAKSQYTLCKMENQGWMLVPNDYAPLPQPKTTGK
jgi:hypothetical protein